MPRVSNKSTTVTMVTKKAVRRFAYPMALAFLAVAVLRCTPLQAQEVTGSTLTSNVSTSSLPDAPPPQASDASATSDEDGHQTKRILGIIPNFRAVNANQHLPPQSVKEKFVTASEDSFDYSSVMLPATIAAFSFGRSATPEFGDGGVGYSRYLWHTVVDQTIENYMVEFVVPAATHEDTRYYTLGRGGFLKRSSYAVSRVLVTRSDAGKRTFNFGEIVGAGAGAGISNLYYPRPERTLSNTLGQWGLNVGIDGGTFVFKEFWPDINHYLFGGEKPHPVTPTRASN